MPDGDKFLGPNEKVFAAIGIAIGALGGFSDGGIGGAILGTIGGAIVGWCIGSLLSGAISYCSPSASSTDYSGAVKTILIMIAIPIGIVLLIGIIRALWGVGKP